MSDVKDNIKKQSTWMRGLYMLLFTIFYTLAEILLFTIVVFQFVLKLLSGDTNDRLRKLGQQISTYIYQILQFMSFNSEQHPYPFGGWPKGEPKPAAKKAIASDEAEETK
ncbi:MAG: DUF4389 domain-containing protein [Gammaproteobacteria bacterium]|nr:DUF4389 domain-containing protein [Gammaproteobacteria bacterium]